MQIKLPVQGTMMAEIMCTYMMYVNAHQMFVPTRRDSHEQ